MDNVLVVLPGASEACTQIMAGRDGIVEEQETFSLNFESDFSTEESSSTTVVNVIDGDSKILHVLFEQWYVNCFFQQLLR